MQQHRLFIWLAMLLLLLLLPAEAPLAHITVPSHFTYLLSTMPCMKQTHYGYCFDSKSIMILHCL